MLGDQQKLTFTSFVEIPDAIKRTYQEWWMIEIDGKIKSRESELLACLGDDDDDTSVEVKVQRVSF